MKQHFLKKRVVRDYDDGDEQDDMIPKKRSKRTAVENGLVDMKEINKKSEEA